ncbi:DUF4394 domain-containing protein [Cellulomonas marina]|uniref:DUF4394 domain-containing protein n=1 Tax=Cellulomonas marina TaxID=988821 RepID=A0A1I0Z1S2_9CELL|nr:DUF4394 domain-containing protein [Cellulomonas marina]GIG28185.1 hypothetical protein Cma02nite_07850 [Cellulomonas marina]SFB19584.1 protein of unknown function [Cellulomonas marina]
MRPTVPALSLAGALLVGVLAAGPAQAAHEGIEVTGLTQNGRLVTFLAGSPEHVTSTVKVTGLKGELLGIDYRPATGGLVGVVRGDDGAGRLVVIDDSTGAVPSSTPLLGLDGTQVLLAGGAFGVDLNPAADALRVVSDADQNLRILLSDRAAGATGTTFVDGALTPGGRQVVGAAYTNSDTDAATGTRLYDISAADDALLLQDPPNAGGLVPVGDGLGLPVGAEVGFDIATRGTSNTALVSVVDRGRATLSVVDLTTGAVVPGSTGTIGTRPAVVDIAVPTTR